MVLRPDLCVVGAGSGGLSVAVGAVQMGASVVLIERGAMGGDCLNTGCVPSKSLLAAAKTAHHVRTAGRFGVNGHEPPVDAAAVHRHVHGVIAAIAPTDGQERMEGLGITVLRATARFVGPDRMETDQGHMIEARRFVLATGSRPVAPPIPGLERVPVLTNETVFHRRAVPHHLIVLGGGPIGCELALAHRRLGAKVTVIERDRLLSRSDPDLVDVVRKALVGEGIDLRETADVIRVEPQGNGVAVVLRAGPDVGAEPGAAGGEIRVEGSDLLVAAGRRPNVESLGLDAAGIAHAPDGIVVDAGLRTTNRRAYAVGDVAGGAPGGPQFTHVAGYHAGVVIRSALFRLPSKVDYRALPRVTYTDPELAEVGMTEAEARAAHPDLRVLTWSFAENDRARADATAEGHVKVLVRPNGRILGAGIVGPQAGELIHTWTLAIHARLKVGAVATMIAPYPTLGEASKRAAGSFFTDRLFGPTTKRIVRALRWLG